MLNDCKSFYFLKLFQNLIIEAVFPAEYFRVNHQTKNGSYFHVTTLKKGVVNIRGSLKGVLSVSKTYASFLIGSFPIIILIPACLMPEVIPV